MSKNEMMAQKIAEINQHIRDGVNQWADVMLMADADQWAVNLNYFSTFARMWALSPGTSTRRGPSTSASVCVSW